MATKKVPVALHQVFSANDSNPAEAVEQLVNKVQAAADGRNFILDWKVIDNAMMKKEFCAIGLVEWVEQ